MIAGAFALLGVVVGYALHAVISAWLEERRWHKANAKWFAELDAEIIQEDRKHGH